MNSEPAMTGSAAFCLLDGGSETVRFCRVPQRGGRCSGCGNSYEGQSLSVVRVDGKWLCLSCAEALAHNIVEIRRAIIRRFC